MSRRAWQLVAVACILGNLWFFWHAFRKSGDAPVAPASPGPSPASPTLSNPVTARGGRLVAIEALGAETRELHRGRQLLLSWLATHRAADLETARQIFAKFTNPHDWYEAMYEAWCLELQGHLEQRDALIRRRHIDRDTYDYTFHHGRDPVKQVLASLQFQACVRHMQFLLQCVELYQADKGVPPPNLAALVPEYVAVHLECPNGGPIAYAVVDDAKGSGQRPLLSCQNHVSYGFPALTAPGSIFDHAVTEISERDHVYDQLQWKARRLDEFAQTIFDALATGAKLKKGDKVADVGSGVGFYSFPMARRVGPTGEVWAVDIKPSVLDFVAFVNRRHPELKVHTRVSRMNDTCLPSGRFDAVIVAHVYRRLTSVTRDEHEYRTVIRPFVLSIWKALKVGGRLVIMDGEPNDTQSILTVAKNTVVREITPVGFTWLEKETVDGIRGDTPHDYVMVFQKTADPSPSPGVPSTAPPDSPSSAPAP